MGRWEGQLRTELVEVEARVEEAQEDLMGLKLELIVGIKKLDQQKLLRMER